ncbi:3-dehydroquinate synthase [Aestuariimicrobium sp. T2.26MG-19.2B]|uniref:3-dehydroquinate synthase n=1 Tax=Aestuariimicrobium sp. T2.26MG-19.2B TaxID=3040679 RepID=UPI0024777E59|nr:3-dehydroquinate synthase [Aestuariimicrobium sp. T2.26MG-19.2B]CAI9409998.1 3-dehydroquinate synthase [Aestuariimicrobium sp. T2.26MG-19.2B]
MTRSLEVNAERPYRVEIGPGVSARLAELVGSAARVAIVHPESLTTRAATLTRDLEAGGRRVLPLLVPTGEQAKFADVLVSCWEQLAEAGFTRSDVVVGLGGGATTDLAGFVAASWLRGVGYVAMPTSVLGMVDAAVGGKTGINLPAGKNLVGAFWEPLGVICDLDTLVDLPPAEVVNGLAEVIKCGFIADPGILDLVEADPREALDPTSEVLAELITRGIAVKARTVSSDLREQTSVGASVGREALNYGHTLGHAIEKAEHFGWRHGEAISVGMVFAAELSARTLGLDESTLARHRAVLASVGLPIGYTGADWAELRAAMSLDKKTRGSALRFVGLPEVGRVQIIDAPDEALLAECFGHLLTSGVNPRD